MISCQIDPGTDTHRVFRFNSSSGITSLDPAFARTQENIRAVSQLFNGLVQLDSNLKVTPCIARSWELSEDGRVYRFILRKDVFFHKHQLFHDREERRVTAADFVYSFNRIMDPSTASDGAWIFNATVEEVEPFRVLNDSTLEIRLRKPFSPFLNMLSMSYCSVVPQRVVESDLAGFGKSPIGTGPFVFANWLDGIRLNFTRNPEYFEAKAGYSIPYIDGISISFVESKQTSLLRFLQGELDAFTGLESSFKDRILDGMGKLHPKLSEEHSLIRSPFLNTEFLGFNMEDSGSILSDLRVRKAINLAIDREAMVTYLRNRVGQPAAYGFIPEGLPSHLRFPAFTTDREQALNLLAHIPADKRTLTLSTTKDYLDLCVLVQNDLKKIGLQLEIDVIPSSSLKQKKSNGELSFFRSSWIADYPDGENYMACFVTANKAPNGPNYTRFSNSEFDRLYELLIQTSATDQRIECIERMEQILAEELPYVLLFYDESIWLTRKQVSGLRINALNQLDLRELRLP